MKRIIFLVCFSTLFSSSFAQSTGVFIGINNAKLSGDTPNDAKYKSLIGLNIGAFFDVDLSENLTISLQPSYTQGGTKIEYKVAGEFEPVDSIKIRVNYFSLPLMLKIASPNDRFYAIGGLEYNMLLDDAISSDDKEQDIDLGLKSWNLTMHFGVGYKVPIGIANLFFELRYSQGLINITDEALDKSYIPRVKTSCIIINSGIGIPLKDIF